MPTNPLYPVVSDLLPLEKIPSELQGLREALENVLDEVYFKDFRVGQSYHGEAAYYAMTLVTFNPLGLNIPFVQDLKLVLNPNGQGNTEIPISFDYSWEVLKYLNGFNFSSFDNSVTSIVEVLMELAGITKTEVLDQVLGSFFTGADTLEDFVSAFNTGQGSSIFVDPTVPTSLQVTDVVNQIEKADLDVIGFVVDQYLTGADFSESLDNLNGVFASWYGSITTDSLNRILKVKFRVLIPNLSVGLQFPRKWLVPVDAQLEPLPEPDVSILSFNIGSLIYSSEAGFEFQEAQSFSLTQSMIGNTGLIIEFTNLKVDLEEGRNIPEADAYGRGPGFKGVYAQTAAITLPKKWFDNTENNPNTTAQLAGYDILVGTGGFSGRLALEVVNGTSDPLLVKTVGTNGFEVGFSAFDINFDRNKIVSSNIAGQLKIPRLRDANGNDAEIDITGHLDSDGDFLITASEQDGFAPIEIPEVLKLYIQGIELGQEDDNFFIGTTAELEFTNAVMNKLLCNEAGGDNIRIALPAIRIYSNGSFEVVGGTIPLPTNFGICLGPAKMNITNLNYTSHQQEYNGTIREYKCWGFDGALNLDPLGVDVRGDGVRYYYTIDDDNANGKPHHSYIRISTIEVDIIIPGNASPDTATAIINGYLSIPEPGVSTEYAGGISVKLPKLGVSGSAEMRLQPQYPAFIVDANVEIPTPIPLASTGLGVFGFRGLLGYRYVAEKEAIGLTSGEDSWYDYYVYPQRGINIDKFSGPEQTTDYEDPVSIGAGASIATYGNDSIISFRVFMLLSIPSLFFVEGKASILSKRLELDDTDEPPFFAFMAIGDDSIEAGLGADFSIPQNNGWILDMQAKVEAGFFFNNPSAWYINFGTRQEPISARLLTLLTAQTYLQLSARGIEAGAKAEFEFNKKYGPVRVRAYAYVEVGGFISFERPQIGGYLAAGGQAEVDIKIISVSIGLDLVFGVEAAKPFLIYGKFRLCVKVRIFLVKIKFCGKVELKWEKSREIDRTPVPPIAQERVLELAKGVHMLTGDTFDLVHLNDNDITDSDFIPSDSDDKFNSTVLPLDTYIDIKFAKPLNPNLVANKTGGVTNAPQNYIELIPPQKTVRGKEVRQVKHAYSMEDIEIKAWDGSAWQDYNPYEVLINEASDLTPQETANLKLGHWQKTGREYNALRILGDNPFSYTQLGEPGWFVPERLGVTASSLFCKTEELELECANWLRKSTDVEYITYIKIENSFDDLDNFFTTGRMSFLVRGPLFLGELGEEYKARVVQKPNDFNFDKSLEIYNFMAVELRLPNPSKKLTFKMSTISEGVTISFYRPIINDISLETEYELVGTLYKTRSQLNQEVVYENAADSFTMVVVQPDFPQVEQINALNEEIEEFYEQAYNDFIGENNGEIVLSDELDNAQVEAKKQEIVDLIQSGCTGSIPGTVLSGGIGQMQIGTSFVVGAKDIVLDSLQDYTTCTSLLHEVCWLSEADYEFNTNIPAQAAIQEDFDLGTDAVSKVVAPIWRPDTKYYIHLKLKDTVDSDEANTNGEYHYYYGFRTAGPLGHFHNAQGVDYGGERDGNGLLLDPDKYPLANLRKYIDYNRSYPNADGNLLQSKPLFYSNAEAKLQLFFVRPQTFHMFNDWPAFNGSSLIPAEMKIMIKDPVNDTLIPYPLPPEFDETTIPGGIESWDEDNAALMPTYLQHWNNLVTAQDSNFSCVVVGGSAIRPKSKIRTVNLTNLKPQKLYTAMVNSVYNGNMIELHNYAFQTSRYANFTEQINSYLLEDGNGNQKEAIFKIQLDLSTAQIDSAYSLIEVEGSPDAAAQVLEDRYVDYFDRIMEGVFGLSPLPTAETTEFNAVVDQNTGDTIALLIRNPEPFNDPKIPKDELRETIKILNNANDDPDGNYHMLYSKDGSQVLIMRNNKRITNNALRFQFRHFLWNGVEYIENDMLLVENINIT
ncbi:hypothetical protein K1F50_06875 [Muricauda oceani]|uniref:Uncharacterized protein n=1 Tax=Flagellimonas oceani TaxID=2698672 RepID=A0A6G7J6F9_9FLAO|nr:hypothetical protein [Allomuricauda oceani]MBW8242520.1 hypothetical protein [Allomuricauda oceani]QII46280.1 hypothetical protein GVT53_16860 [Allomuricauda oceani]